MAIEPNEPKIEPKCIQEAIMSLQRIANLSRLPDEWLNLQDKKTLLAQSLFVWVTAKYERSLARLLEACLDVTSDILVLYLKDGAIRGWDDTNTGMLGPYCLWSMVHIKDAIDVIREDQATIGARCEAIHSWTAFSQQIYTCQRLQTYEAGSNDT